MTNESPTLRTCFEDAEAKRKVLETAFDSNSATFQENLTSAIEKYEECVKIAAQVSFFSPNETLEDVSSGDLQLVFNHVFGSRGATLSSRPQIFPPTLLHRRALAKM